MTTDQGQRFKEAVRDQWTHAADAWRAWHPQVSEMSRDVTQAIVEAARLQPGLDVLDLVGGTGEPALSIAKLVSPEGTVTCTDLVPGMVETAEANARAQGLTNMRFQQVDAESIPFPDDSFDRVTCRFGVMFMPHIDAALREMRRVLKPGGVAAFVVWATADENPGFGSINRTLTRLGLLTPPEPGAPTPFAFARPGSLSEALERAGFHAVEEQARRISWTWPGTAEQYWHFMSATLPAMRRAIEALPETEQSGARSEVLQTLRQFEKGGKVAFGAKIYVVSAVK